MESAAPTDIVGHLREFVSAVIRPEVSIRFRGRQCRDITCTHRKLDEQDVFFLSNNADQAREVQISLRCDGAPYMLDLETGAAVALPDCTQRGGRTVLLRLMEAGESLLIYFDTEPALAIAPRRPLDGRSIKLADDWDFQRLQLSGHPFHSGTAYTQTIEIPRTLPSERVFLRVHDAAGTVEFVVNGVCAGVRAWVPFHVHITGLVSNGPNAITLNVTSLARCEPHPPGITGAEIIIC